ncbi:MAG: putative rane protein [Solirubrobacterales bacterium]|jgi:cytochrome c oxidase assembly factor CtaG|nr:putative rane protein [Solirubrobacterales bacterium]
MVPLGHLASPAFAPLQVLPPLAIAFAYWTRARTLAARGRPVPAWRQLCFGSGLALILAALASPLGHVSGELMLAHMVEHLLIGDLATLLIVLGLTGPLLQPVLAVPALDRLRALTHPLVAFPLWLANLYLWHLPALYGATLHSQPLHALEHGLFVGLGIAMWMPLAGPLPTPAWFGNGARAIYVAVVRLAGTALANVFVWSGQAFYPGYARGEAHWKLSPLADQSTAGVIMMIEGSFVTLGLLAWLFIRWAKQSEESQALLDYAEDHGVALDAARADRAVAAGRGGELADRLAERA